MKIRHEIAEFLAFKVAQGLTPHSAHLCQQALTALLGHVLEEPGDSLTPERMDELGRELRKRPSPRTDKPLAEGTIKTYLTACRLFIRWRTLRRLPQDSAGPEPSPSTTTEAEAQPSSAPLHPGELAQRLREARGLKRSDMTAQTGLTATEIRALEMGRDSAPKTWRALLGHPAMQGLPELAQQAGLALPVEDLGKRGARRPLTVAEAIGFYLDSQYERGVQNNSLVTAACVLRSFFRPALHAPLSSLYPDQARQIAAGLSERIGTHTKRPLTKPTCRRYRVQASLFLRWCVEQKRLPGNPLVPPAQDEQSPGRAAHLGELVRTLREAAGLTRLAFGSLARLNAAELRSIELGRRTPSADELRRIMLQPAMNGLAALAEQAGLALDLDRDSDPKGKE